MSSNSNNQRIAKNTILLYIRTALVLIISLYTSRLVLKALGVEDLGIYNVVGGIVSLMAAFRSALSKSTSRFITYAIGENGDGRTLTKIFSTAMMVHLLIACIMLLVGETIGLFILKYWTDIPEIRFQAALYVYQCVLVIFCINTVIAPYESVLIAYENMSVYAYLTILASVSKLIIAWVMLYSNFDRLILYGILMVFMDILVFLCYYIYNRKKYPLFRFNYKWDKQYSKQMFSFSGWTLLGTSSNAISQQGVGLLFNNFVGLVANAALGFANQINGAVQQFVSSFQTAFNPQIIKLYAQNELSQMHLLMSRASKFSFLLAYVVTLPLLFNTQYLLGIWLGEVPQYTEVFCQLILISCVIDSVTGVFYTAITATGKIRNFQIWISVSFFLDLILSAILLLLQMHPALVFGSRILTRGIINMYIELVFVRKQLLFNIWSYIKNALFPMCIAVIITIPIMWFVSLFFERWSCLIITTLFSIISCSLLGWYIFLSSNERETIRIKIKEINLKKYVTR